MKALWGFLNFSLVSLLLVGCLQGEMKSRVLTEAGPGRLCQAPSSVTQGTESRGLTSHFEIQGRKVMSHDFLDLTDSQTESLVSFTTQSSDLTLKVGFPLVAMIDRRCAMESSSAVIQQAKRQIRPWSHEERGSLIQSVTYRLETAMTLSELEQFLASQDCVLGVSPDRALQAFSLFNDPLYAQQNALQSVRHSQAWPKFSQLGEEVVVAVVDSGTDLEHPELRPTAWENTDEVSGNGIDDDRNGFVDDRFGWDMCSETGNVGGEWGVHHGEHVHGIIAAAANNNEGIVGLASPLVKVMTFKLYNMSLPGFSCRNTMSETARLEEGIRYAADNGADVINLSWGARGFSTTTLAAVQYAISKGAVVVAAAANHAEVISENNPWYPAVYAKDLPGLISVAATDAAPTSGAVKCAFSNISNIFVEIAAPGCDTTVQNSTYGLNGILSTLRWNSIYNGYGTMPGTSMATPHVAAAVAVVQAQQRSRGLNPSPGEVEALLMNGSRSQNNLLPFVVGGRHLDLEVLMNSLELGGGSPPPPCEK